MKKRFKKAYCENCNKDLLVEEGEFFCPICASYLTDKGEIVEKEIINDDKKKKGKVQPKKKALNDSGIIVLEGAKNKEIFNKTKLNKVKTALQSITFMLLIVAIGLFYHDLSNKVNLIKEWTTETIIGGSYYYASTHKIYFLSQKNCSIFAILLGVYFLLTAIIVLINAINKLTACSIERRSFRCRPEKRPDEIVWRCRYRCKT